MQAEIVKSLAQFQPHSIFLYGSRGRGDYRPDSDYEVGVIFDDAGIVSRSLIQQRVQLDSVHIYPFRLSEVMAGRFNNPFPDSIFTRELVEGGGKTIYGPKVVESLAPPPITTLDLVRRIRFDIGCAFEAVLFHREQPSRVATKAATKSCLFGLRLLVILKDGKFPCGYDEIYQAGRSLELDQRQRQTVEGIYLVHSGQGSLTNDLAFNNLFFLGSVEAEVLQKFKADGIVELA